jgi:hypothetical protein
MRTLMSNLVDNTNKRTSIKIYAITYNTVTLRHFSIFIDNFFFNYAVQPLTLRVLISYIYGVHILDVSRSHTTTHHSQ